MHFAPVAYFLWRTARIPYWIVAHGIEAWELKHHLLQTSLYNAERILAVSNYTRDKLVSNYGFDETKVRILPNTIDPQKFQIAAKPNYLLERYHIQSDQPVIFTLSRLWKSEKYKGYDKILQAILNIRVSIPNVKYVLAGKGDDIPRIEQLIKKLNLDKYVILTGFLKDEELKDHYNLCDVFAMPSKKEGFGIVFLEAMASGKPTLAGNKDGSVDALCNGELGVLVDPDNVQLIAKTLVEILNHTFPHPLIYNPEKLRKRVVEVYGVEQFKETLRNNLSEFFNDTHTNQVP